MMASLSHIVTSANLRTILETLRQQKHTQLLKGMQHFAARFCGEILLTTERTPTPKNGSRGLLRQAGESNRKKTSVSELSGLDATIQSLLKRVNRQTEALQDRFRGLEHRLDTRHTLPTKAKKTSRKAASRYRGGRLNDVPLFPFGARQEKCQSPAS